MTTSLAIPVTPAAADRGTLAPGYRNLVALCEALDVRVAGPGAADAAHGAPEAGAWVTGAELVERPEALSAFVAAESARIRQRHGLTPRPDVAASRALHDYLWSVSLLMSGVWYLERRVPRIRPAEIRLDLSTGVYEVTPGSAFACLPDDPAAGEAPTPGVRAVGREALRAELRAAVADHVGPLLTAIAPHVRRGPRALWGMAGDDLLSGVWYLGRVLGQEDRAVNAATELLPTAVAPFPAGADFRRLAGRDGRRYPTRTRTGCCLYYALDAARPCGTCPRTGDAERVRRLDGEA
ncbi:iron-sulfur protein [Streptomyces sp. NPDC001744]|uniref:iron-sulfur protein n=1 Tax=Streptomyces sp. NPDC001744 TaxID=3364606 RepID=UPI0036B4BE9F